MFFGPATRHPRGPTPSITLTLFGLALDLVAELFDIPAETGDRVAAGEMQDQTYEQDHKGECARLAQSAEHPVYLIDRSGDGAIEGFHGPLAK
jgi:hypothetical protein